MTFPRRDAPSSICFSLYCGLESKSSSGCGTAKRTENLDLGLTRDDHPQPSHDVRQLCLQHIVTSHNVR